MRIAMGALGQSSTSTTTPLETSLPWYQQFWDEFINPVNDFTVLNQQTGQLAGQINQTTANVSSILTSPVVLVIGGLGIVLLVFAMSKR